YGCGIGANEHLDLFLISGLVPPPPPSTLFPYTTLFRSDSKGNDLVDLLELDVGSAWDAPNKPRVFGRKHARAWFGHGGIAPDLRDRKSTRLNSSHLVISYAVFCLKKKHNPGACNSETLI